MGNGRIQLPILSRRFPFVCQLRRCPVLSKRQSPALLVLFYFVFSFWEVFQ